MTIKKPGAIKRQIVELLETTEIWLPKNWSKYCSLVKQYKDATGTDPMDEAPPEVREAQLRLHQEALLHILTATEKNHEPTY